MEGRLPETVLKGGAGSGVLRPRLVTAGSGGPGHRPPGMTTWLRGASLYGSGGNAGDGSAAPGRKSPRWSAERRASRVMGRAAPHSRGSVASRKRDNRNSAPVGAPPTPPSGDGRDHKDKTRAQQRAAGTKNTALFDIVNTATANGSCASRDRVRATHPAPIPSARHRDDSGRADCARNTCRSATRTEPKSRRPRRPPRRRRCSAPAR